MTETPKQVWQNEVPATFVNTPSFTWSDIGAEKRAVVTGPVPRFSNMDAQRLQEVFETVFGTDGLEFKTLRNNIRFRVDLTGEAYEKFKTAFDRQTDSTAQGLLADALQARISALSPQQEKPAPGYNR